MSETLGLYLSIPFCRGKCTFCNFASDVFAPGLMPAYVAMLCAEIASARERARRMGAVLPGLVDTVYLGGGTPSLLSAEQVAGLFAVIRGEFHVAAKAEITMECAPGQLSGETLEAFQKAGGDRISFGVQSFADVEAAAVGRRHTGAVCRAEIDRVRAAGLRSVGVDLIAGLPLQTRGSWRMSLAELLASEADHASVYLFEVDEESRLGREVLSEGARFSAQSVPDEYATAEMYGEACEVLENGGLRQYEISNFAREGRRSRHNLKYWRREPYLGFGLDAHSMLQVERGGEVRFANGDELEGYLGRGVASSPLPLLAPAEAAPEARLVTTDEALEEMMFLGLRMNDGLAIGDVARVASAAGLRWMLEALHEAQLDELLCCEGDRFQLTAHGRLLSNEVFARLLLPEAAAA